MKGRILVADDDPGILEIIGFAFTKEGFDVSTVSEGEAALQAALDKPWDVVILDVMLGDISGIEVCRAVRAESGVPILMLTAKDAEADRVLGLETGADDYVTKPFSMAELASRVRAILRRRELDRKEGGRAVRVVGSLKIDFPKHTVTVDDEPVHLTRSEFKVLAVLAGEPERVFSRREIMQRLWDSDHVGDEHPCDVHISNIRRKIERDPANPERIATVRGIGYKLVPAG